MNRLAVILALFTLTACGTAGRLASGIAADIRTPALTTTPDNVQPVAPEPQPGLSAEFSRIVAFTRADVQNALDGATNAKPPDELGINCHKNGLSFLDALGTSHVKVTGIASLAEDVRLKRRALTGNMVAFQTLQDNCAAVYNVRGLLKPAFDALGLVMP
jgi:hypothetical protein